MVSSYDPNTAQFLTPDPLTAMTGELYGYAGNNLINNDDPLGLCAHHSGILGGHRDAGRHIGNTAHNDVYQVALRNRVVLSTIGATAFCFIPAIGWGLCGVAQGVAFGVRAQQRASEEGGFSCTWKADGEDLAITSRFWFVGSSAEILGPPGTTAGPMGDVASAGAGAPGATKDLSTLNRKDKPSCSCR